MLDTTYQHVYNQIIERKGITHMNGKIQNLKNAYASGNHDKLFRAACALVNYDKKHPFAALTYSGAEELVALAKKIQAAGLGFYK